MKYTEWLYAIALVLVAGVVTSKSLAHEQHQHGPHVHGIGLLQVAVDGDLLSITLEVPAINIVGFEHPPGDPEEKNRVQTAAKLLGEGVRLFTPSPSAGCKVEETHVDSKLLEKKHAHDDHDGEDHHSEFHATYSFRCKDPKKLTTIDVHLFRFFPATEKLEARFVTSNGQGAAYLLPDASRLAF